MVLFGKLVVFGGMLRISARPSSDKIFIYCQPISNPHPFSEKRADGANAW